MKVRIRIYGADQRVSALRRALEDEFGECEISEGSYAEDAESVEVSQSDVVIANFTKENGESAYSFLGRVIKAHGVFIYLATVVIAPQPAPTPQDPRLIRPTDQVDPAQPPPQQTRTLRDPRLLRATDYVDSAESENVIASTAKRSYQKSWWYGTRQQGLPTLVVDRHDNIVRANTCARTRFNGQLVGSPYATAIEKARVSKLSNEHPVVKARKDQAVVSEDRSFLSGDEKQRFYVICSPLITTGPRPASTAVMLLDMTRSERIFGALKKFADTKSSDDLYRQIVDAVCSLGIRRARLYEYLPGNREFVLRAVSGYENAGEVIGFSFKLDEDRPSLETMESRRTRLFEYVDEDREDTDLTRYFRGPPNFASFIGRDGVFQWIDAPVLLPDAEGKERFWGKLSVDQGVGGERFDGRDVDDIALFSIVLCNALSGTLRLELQNATAESLRRQSQSVVNAVSGSGNLATVIDIVLQLCKDITRADVLVYREYDPALPNALRRCGSLQDPQPGWSVPLDVPLRLSGFDFTRRGSSEELKPYILVDAEFQNVGIANAEGFTFTADERAYLTSIRSEMHVPVFRNGELHGILIAASMTADAFVDDMVMSMGRMMYVVSSWIELARHHNGQLWVEQAIGNAIRCLPLLGQAPLHDDERFFAGAAALLTSHHGLQWNRMIVYACSKPHLHRAELIYAIGGLANGQESHKILHRGISAEYPLHDPSSLERLVASRIDRPAPDWQDPHSQTTVVDELYQLCVGSRNKDERIFETYGMDGPDNDLTMGPVQKLLGPASDLHPLTNEHIALIDDDWIRRLSQTHAGMFDPAKTVYAFPLWSVSNQSKEPLGVVFLDMQHRSNQPFEKMIAATRVLLGLLGDMLSERHMLRRLRGVHRALPAVLHRRDLKSKWEVFSDLFVRFFKEASSSSLSSISATNRALQVKLVSLHEEFDRVEDELRKGILSQDGEQFCISDVGKLLRGLEKRLPAGIIDVQIRDPAIDGLCIEGDVLVLQEVLHELLKNAHRAGGQDRKFRILVEAFLAPSPCMNYGKMLHIRVMNNGPAIPPDLAKYLFVKGVTTQPDGGKHGSGLAINQVLLNDYFGELRLCEPTAQWPVCFEIVFGVPHARLG